MAAPEPDADESGELRTQFNAPRREQLSERQIVYRRRRVEAREAGMSLHDAALFAAGDADIGQLRKLVAGRCEPRLLAQILNEPELW